jgi:hypothetical protein
MSLAENFVLKGSWDDRASSAAGRIDRRAASAAAKPQAFRNRAPDRIATSSRLGQRQQKLAVAASWTAIRAGGEPHRAARRRLRALARAAAGAAEAGGAVLLISADGGARARRPRVRAGAGELRSVPPGATAPRSARSCSAEGGMSEALLALLSGLAGQRRRAGRPRCARAAPLLITGLAVALAFRGGAWNIGRRGSCWPAPSARRPSRPPLGVPRDLAAAGGRAGRRLRRPALRRWRACARRAASPR